MYLIALKLEGHQCRRVYDIHRLLFRATRIPSAFALPAHVPLFFAETPPDGSAFDGIAAVERWRCGGVVWAEEALYWGLSSSPGWTEIARVGGVAPRSRLYPALAGVYLGTYPTESVPAVSKLLDAVPSPLEPALTFRPSIVACLRLETLASSGEWWEAVVCDTVREWRL